LLILGTRIRMMKKKAAVEVLKLRKTPLQTRSAETVALIVEAAARILELDGFEGFNTNAIAEKAGVSIGSLYQYFPSKDALLSAIIERETAPLLSVSEDLVNITDCKSALRYYIRASIRHQMRRPQLARLIDVAEKREIFNKQVSGTASRLQAAVERVLQMPDAPHAANISLASADLLAIIRSLVDAAGERGEGASEQLLKRVEGAVWGYLREAPFASEAKRPPR
jgi:AcrR family transcriptional regulator